MKEGIHPEDYRTVVFKDMSNESSFLGKSTAPTGDTIVHEDGNEYPLIKLEISNTSHPYFTGKNLFVDTAGRIDKFKNKYAKWDRKKGNAPAEEAAPVQEAAPVTEAPKNEAPASDAPTEEAGSEEAKGE